MFTKIAKVALPLVLLVSAAVVALPSVAGAAGTSLLAEAFDNPSLASTQWSLPAGSSGVCLTSGTDTLQVPVPDCQSSGGDATGSGAIQFTNNADNQVGTIFSDVALPTANGLDVTWDSYQFDGTGADGISFDLAAVNPSDPVPPSATGPSGGSLGYAAKGSTPGMPYGYLGFGADVFGNFENSPTFSGSGCAETSPATPESMGVRGPGNGSAGYCLLAQNNLATHGALTLDSQTATSRTGLAVPEEVVLNTSGAPVVATVSGITVQPGDYLFATEPLLNGAAGSVWYSVTGALPTDPVGVPSNWLGTNGLPQEMAFGWASSTGGSTEIHQINLLQASSLTASPVLSLANTDSGTGTLYTGSSSTVTLTAGVDPSSTVDEAQPVTVTDVLPSNLTPTSASGSGWTCSVTGQDVSCTQAPGTEAPGTTLPPISVAVTVGATAGSFTNSATATSSDGAPATAADAGSIESLIPQAIGFTTTPPSPLYVNDTYPVVTTGGGSGNPVILTVDPSSTSGCTINGSHDVTFSTSGTCVIDANQAGNGTYAAAPQVQQSMTAVDLPQDIVFTNAAPTSPFGDSTYDVTTNGGGPSGNPVVLTVDPSSTSGCAIDGAGNVTLLAPIGTCVIDANQEGGGSFAAAPQVQQSVTDVPLAQVINFTNTPPSSLYVNGTYTVTTTGGLSGSPVVLTVDPSSTSGCTVDTSTGIVTLSAPSGSCIIDANQAASGVYSAATQTSQTTTILPIAQDISFTNTPPSPLYVNGTYTVATTGGASGNPVTYTVDGASTSGCIVDPLTGAVTMAAPAGSCVIDANQEGDGGYAAAPQVQQTTNYVTTPQVVTFTNSPPALPYVNATYTVTSNGGGASGNPVVFSIDPSSTSGCTVATSTGVVTLSAPAGTCIIDANQTGNSAYAAAPQVQQSITSIIIPQDVAFTNTPPTSPRVNTTYTVTTTGGASGNPVVLTVDPSSTSGCTVATSTGVVTMTVPAGSCIVDANQAGIAGEYSAAPQVQQTTHSSVNSQSIAFTSTPPTLPAVGSTYTVTASSGGSGTAVVFTVDPSSTSGCTVNSSTGVVTLSAPAGTCVIDANEPGTSAFSAAPQVQQSVASVSVAQKVTFTSTAPSNPAVGSTYTVTAVGGGSGSTIVYSVSPASTSGCTVTAKGVVTLSAPAGTCIVIATQPGNATYTVGTATQTVTSRAVHLSLILHYANNSWALSTWSTTHLTALAHEIARYQVTKVTIDGFASSTGLAPRNNVLGLKRASVAAAFLKAALKKDKAHGVTIHSIGNGATQFVVNPPTAAGNRRTVITVS
jgi:outer membrane protein OmpA-like peptidoglycan-associated protein